MGRPENFGIDLTAILSEYTEEITAAVKQEVKAAGKGAAALLRQESPRSTSGGNHYADGWKSKVAYESPDDIRVAVYNGKKPGLAHLLEFGHVVRNGTGRTFGRVEGFEHIQPIAEKTAQKLGDRVKVRATDL